MQDNKTKIIERKLPSGATEYGLQRPNGSVKWYPSLPHATFAYGKSTLKKKRK